MSNQFNIFLNKWLRGDFNRRDEEAVHRHLAEDAFSKEAWEGYQTSPEFAHEEKIKALKERLAQKHPIERVRPMDNTPRFGMIAAAILLLAGAVWFFYQKNPFQQASMATNQEVSAPKSAMPEDNVLANDAVIPNAESDEKQEQPIEKKPEISSNASKSKMGEKTASNQASKAPSSAPSVAASPKVRQANPPKDQENGGDFVEMEAYSAAPDAIPATRNNQAVTETAAPAVLSSPPAPIAKTKSSPAKEMGKELGKEFPTDRTVIESAKPSADASASAPVPALGWDDFRAYLARNARLTPEARNNNITGAVRLRFEVSREGEPQNFVVKKSLGYGCDEEAIRLVQEGGTWFLGEKTNFIELDVPFRR